LRICRSSWKCSQTLLLLFASGLVSGCGMPEDKEKETTTSTSCIIELPRESAKTDDTITSDVPTSTAGTSANDKKVEKKTAEAHASTRELEPFDPPPLEKLNAEAKWVAQPVHDCFDLLRAKLAKEKSLATVEEALQIKNDSADANAKILSALGRLPASDDEVDWDATFNRHLTSDIRSSNPLLFSLAVDGEIQMLTSFNLVAFDWNLELFGDGQHIVSWETSADRMVDKIVLRDDLTWSDGQTITAHDIAFTFQTLMNPKVPAIAVKSGPDKLRWVHAYDDHTVVFFHKEALAANAQNIVFPAIPKHIYEKSVAADPTLVNSEYHVKLEQTPVCGGPYKIASRVRGQEIILERREDYYMHGGKQVRPKPYLKTVRCNIIEDRNTALLAVKKGDLDEMMLMPGDWTSKTTGDDFYEKNTKATGPEWTTFQFTWNMRTPFFSDVRVRKAMSYCYNYEEMDTVFNFGLYHRSRGIFHPDSWMAPKPPPALYQQDFDKAAELLEEAGWTDTDGDGVLDKTIDGKKVRFEFTIYVPNITERIKYATLLKECLDKLGVVCNVKPMEFVAMTERVQKHEFEAAFGGWGTGSDPESVVNIFGTNELRNYAGYTNPEVDKLFILGSKEFDKKKRAEIYGKIHTMIYDEQPYTWLFTRSSFYAFNKNLRGYLFSPRDPFGYMPGLRSIWKPKK
jgi:peptide/nickel transport system substrate-binding protein